MNKESLLAGINSLEFRFREADFGQFPKGLLYGLQCFDSWLFDDEKPFLHLECLDTFAELKKKVDTGFYVPNIGWKQFGGSFRRRPKIYHHNIPAYCIA